MIILLQCYILLINREWGHYSLQGNLRLRPWCITRSIHQGWGLRFPCKDWMDEVNKLVIIIIMTFSLWTWACNQLKPTTGQQITLKNTTPQWVVQLSPQYSQVILVSGYPFWQLSIDHNTDVYKDVHYQVQTQIAYALDT